MLPLERCRFAIGGRVALFWCVSGAELAFFSVRPRLLWAVWQAITKGQDMNSAAENAIELEQGWWATADDTDYQQVTLYRVEGGKEMLLDRVTVTRESVPTVEDFQIEVKANYGGGVYVAVARGAGGEFKKRLQFAVAGIPKREAEQAAPQPQGGELNEVIRLLMSQQQASETRMLAALEKLGAKPAESDPFAMVERVAGILSKVGGAPIPQKSMIEQMNELKAVSEFMESMKGGGGEQDGWMGLIGQLPSLIEMAKQGQSAVQPGQPVAAVMAPAQAAPVMSGAAMEQLKTLVGALLPYAEAKAEPATIAATLIERAPDAAALQAFAARPDAVELLLMLEPKAKPYAAWFRSLANELSGYECNDGNGNGIAGRAAADQAGQSGTRRGRSPADAGHHARAGAGRPVKHGRSAARADLGRRPTPESVPAGSRADS